ncbi:MAG: hypothetical protein A3J97_03500 [Spirochaetes bacterium RIFOXYC1_FULL_54_7]|nr:MAG: hypothetical protein A3J97_03500 [Spirochaetes bacterium RIFOXYC1_FULL_54_7]
MGVWMQQTALEWTNRYHALYRDLNDWVEYRDLPEEEKSPAEETAEGKEDRFHPQSGHLRELQAPAPIGPTMQTPDLPQIRGFAEADDKWQQPAHPLP